MENDAWKNARMKSTALVVFTIVLLFHIQCVRDKSVIEPMPLLQSNYFPIKVGQTWHYQVKQNEHIATPPFRNIWHVGAEKWTLVQKNDADSILVFAVNFSGIKISIDTTGIADTTFDQAFSAELPVFLQEGRLIMLGRSEDAPIFFDNWLGNVNFQIYFPDSTKHSLILTSDNYSNNRWQYSLERNIGLRNGEWSANYIFGSYFLQYGLMDLD